VRRYENSLTLVCGRFDPFDGSPRTHADFIERLAAFGREKLRYRSMRSIDFGIALHDLAPREAFPRAELHLSPILVERKRNRTIADDDARGFARAREIACDRARDRKLCEQRGETDRLRATGLVEWNIALALEPSVRIPCGPAVPNDGEFEGYFSMNGRP
jgi:hypothetical protein